MKKVSKILLFVAIFAVALVYRAEKSEAYEYIWPVGGTNANETYKDYDFYGKAYAAPYKNGKSGREYVVNNKLWPSEKYYYASCESHYGMDITGISGHTYTIVSVCNGTVIGTSGTRANNPSVNYVDRNQRRTSAGLNDGGGYGNYILIQESTTGRCFLYGHLKGGSLKVKKGDTVISSENYDISYEDLMLDLGWLNDKGDCYVRLIHEVRTKRTYTEDKVNLFRKYCEAFESRFPCIKFWSGRNLYDYYEDYKFWYQPTCLELYSSVVFPNIPYPKGYAKTHNKSNICLAKHTNYDILLIDFVNIRE